jgi:hypothetical protein
MEYPSSQQERLDKLFAHRKHRAIAHKEVSVGSRFLQCWNYICMGNLPKALTELALTFGTMYNTIVNPKAGVRRKR